MPIVSRLFVLSVLILASCYVSGAEFKQLEFQATSTAFTEDCRYLMADNKESIVGSACRSMSATQNRFFVSGM